MRRSDGRLFWPDCIQFGDLKTKFVSGQDIGEMDLGMTLPNTSDRLSEAGFRHANKAHRKDHIELDSH